MAGSRPAARTAQAKATQRTKPKAGRPAAVPAQPTYTGALAQYAAPEGFGAGAYMRAQQAGLTEEQIRAGVEELRNQGLKIGARVETAVQGPGSFTDYGSGAQYGSRAIFMPGQEGVGTAGKGVFWAAGPMTNQQVVNMLSGQARESYVLPASLNDPSQPYRAPSGTPFVDVTASQAEQMRQAVEGLNIPQLPMVPTAATAGKAVKAKQLAKKAKQKTGRKARPKGMDLSKYYGAGALSVGRYGAGG